MIFREQSAWIWESECAEENQYAETTERFHAEMGDCVSLVVSVEGQYAVFLNGAYVPSTQYCDFPWAKAVQTIDLTACLVSGGNDLAIQCWYPGADTSVSRREAPGLRYELIKNGELIGFSGEHTRIRPLRAYQSGKIPAITWQMGAGFAYRLCEDAPWKNALCVKKPAVCVHRPIRELRVETVCPARLVSQGTFCDMGGACVGERMQTAGLYWRDARDMCAERADGGASFMAAERDGIYLAYDLGRLRVGYLSLDIVCPENAAVDVGFGEHIQDLRVRTYIDGRSFGVTGMAGPNRKRFVHWFRRLAARYLVLFVHSREAIVYGVGILPVNYPVDTRPEMRLTDHLHARIASVSRDTLLSCMHEHYEDCPWREQALYAFDARNQMLAGYYAFGEFTFARESIRLLMLSQREDGWLELCAPARVAITIPSFSLIHIVSVEEYVRFSGDAEFGREMLPRIEKIVAAFIKQVADDVAWRLTDPVYWNFYEWQTGLDGEAVDGPSAEAPLQLFGILALQRLRALREMLSLPADGAALDWEKRLTRSMERYWNEDMRAYASFLREGAQTHYAALTQALALYTHICPRERERFLLNHLSCETLTPVTLSHSIFQYEALLRESAYAPRAWDAIAERWGGMLFQGATTFWEVDEGAEAFDRAGSLCHGWSAIPLYLYGAYAMGVRPAEMGVWKVHDTKNVPFGAKGTLRAPNGYIAVK